MVQRSKGGVVTMAILSWTFRIFLLIGSVTVFTVISLSIRKRKLQMKDGIFWIMLSFTLVLISIFPIITVWVSRLLGIQSAANCVFFLIIFLLGCHAFHMTIRMSQMEMKHRKLVQDIAIQQLIESEEKDRS